MEQHLLKIQSLVTGMSPDIRKFNMGNHKAGTRLRKQLQDIKRACQGMRDDIQAERTKRRIHANKF